MNMINKLFRMRSCTAALFFATIAAWTAGCTPDKGGGLGALPKPDFTVSGGGTSNSVSLLNTTPGPNIAYWSSPGHAMLSGDSATYRYTFQGVYPITLTAIGQGGLDTLTQQVTIDQNDPTACTTTVQGFIAGCTQKVWKLNPADNAMGVGPAPGNVSYFATTAADATSSTRGCDFNDTYTFSFNAAGTFVFDNMGDYYTEGYLGNDNNDCDVNSDLTPTEKPWGSGTFTYLVIDNAGALGLGQLEVIGLGAHIGFARATDGADDQTAPVNSITYDIVSMTHDPAGYDLLTIAVNEGSAGSPLWWTWTLRSY
jgi:PKD repeat protein